MTTTTTTREAADLDVQLRGYAAAVRSGAPESVLNRYRARLTAIAEGYLVAPTARPCNTCGYGPHSALVDDNGGIEHVYRYTEPTTVNVYAGLTDDQMDAAYADADREFVASLAHTVFDGPAEGALSDAEFDDLTASLLARMLEAGWDEATARAALA